MPNRSRVGKPFHNVSALLEGGRVRVLAKKTLLPTYDVFDEGRWFEPGDGCVVVPFRGERLGLPVCEDLWNDKDFWRARRLYRDDPGEALVRRGATLVVTISASPFSEGKPSLRRRMLARYARDGRVPVASLNLVGGNDELVFDGGSMVLDSRGRIAARAALFEEDFLVVDVLRDGKRPARVVPVSGADARDLPDDVSGDPLESLRRALVLGIRDYAGTCGFRSAVLGLSGGIDSALVAALAVEALGAENVTGLAMPSPYSSEGSVADARALAANLGIRCDVLSIGPLFEDARRTLAPLFGGLPEDVTEENVQSRLRGMLLMAVSNKKGPLVLTTGNKSELAVGYCTLYGDMCGGLAPISDLPKMRVYALARHLNARRARAHSRGFAHEGAVRRAPAGSDRPGFPSALSASRRDPRESRGAESLPRRGGAPDGRPARARQEDRDAGGPGRVQAQSGGARPEGLREGLRERPPDSHRAEGAALKAADAHPGPHYPWKEIPGSSHVILLEKVLARGSGLAVLDLGFGAGLLARRIRPACRYLAGVELDPEAAKEGARFFDQPVVGDLLDGISGPFRERFDVIVAGDVLEHLPRPEDLLSALRPLLKTDGVLLLSLPNIANATVRFGLLFGRFAYARRGILDRTHLRFFTQATGRALLEENGYRVVSVDATAMPLELAVPALGRPPLAGLARAAALSAARLWPTLLGYQFVYEARPA